MWLTHVAVTTVLIVLAVTLVAGFVYGVGSSGRSTKKRIAEQVAAIAEKDATIKSLKKDRDLAVNRIAEQDAAIKRIEKERDFAEQLMRDLLNETVDKKLVQAKIAVLVAAKGASEIADEIADVAKVGLSGLRERLSWRSEADRK